MNGNEIDRKTTITIKHSAKSYREEKSTEVPLSYGCVCVCVRAAINGRICGMPYA